MSTNSPRRRPSPPRPLPLGTRLGSYEVRKVLGIGAYGIVYRVANLEALVDPDADTDVDLERDLAVREYLPAALARREGDQTVVTRSAAQVDAFDQGRRFFLNEGELLAQLRHPSLVKVHRSWEHNGTVYRAMTLVHGRTLSDTLQARGKPRNEAALNAVLLPLLDALEVLHTAGIEHRDIAPQNIMLEPNGRPVLLDLDSPRRVSSAAGATGPEGPRDGYAPVELYGAANDRVRGPWTDFYALAATLHFLMTGKPPPSAPTRGQGDLVAPNLARKDGRFSPGFLGVIDWMLAPEPADRPQSVAQLRDGLAGKGLPERYRPSVREKFGARLRRHKRWLWAGSGGLIVAAAATIGALHKMGIWRLPGL